MTASVLRLVALALIGLAIAAGTALAISRLVSQDIGLQSEPLSAGDRLAPPASSPLTSGPGAGQRGEDRRSGGAGRDEDDEERHESRDDRDD